jgi:hypothetical protein
VLATSPSNPLSIAPPAGAQACHTCALEVGGGALHFPTITLAFKELLCFQGWAKDLVFFLSLFKFFYFISI